MEWGWMDSNHRLPSCLRMALRPLSYNPMYSRRDSNPQHATLEAAALPLCYESNCLRNEPYMTLRECQIGPP